MSCKGLEPLTIQADHSLSDTLQTNTSHLD
jgi:hypothetical protein